MTALVGGGVFAVPASAHTGDWTVTCDHVSVHLTAYGKNVANSVTLSVLGGEGVLAFNPDFGSAFAYDAKLPGHDTPLSLHLVVKSADGHKYDIDQVKTSPVCAKPPTTPPTTHPATLPPTTVPPTTPPTAAPPTTATAPSTTPPTTPATTAPTAAGSAPVAAATSSAPAAGGLAETGSSSATPMIAGIAAGAVAVGAGALVFARKRRSSSHR